MADHWSLAGVLSDRDIARLLKACADTRYPDRNRTIVLLACEAGLEPREIAGLKRTSVQTDDGLVGDHIIAGLKSARLRTRRIPLATKGRLKQSIIRTLSSFPGKSDDPLIVGERWYEGAGEGDVDQPKAVDHMRPSSIGYIFWKLARKAGIDMAGGRDARKTFIVRVGRAIGEAGRSTRDVQLLAGHRSLESTQALIDADLEAQSRVIGTLFDKITD